MTIKELIEKLQEYDNPDQIEVRIAHIDWEIKKILPVQDRLMVILK